MTSKLPVELQFLYNSTPQIDVQREIKADADFLCQFLLELNISMDPSNVPFDVCFDSYISMDPFNVLFNV